MRERGYQHSWNMPLKRKHAHHTAPPSATNGSANGSLNRIGRAGWNSHGVAGSRAPAATPKSP